MLKKQAGCFKRKQKKENLPDGFEGLINILKGSDPKETNLQEFYKLLTLKKSKENIRQFSLIPFSERIILLPQCLRNVERCKAKEVGNRYECQECGACKIAQIIQNAKKLGYKGIYILKGGSALSAMIEKTCPKAILGVACYYEGLIGMTACEKRGIPVQFVPLTKDGCANTDLNLADLQNLINFNPKFAQD